MESESPDPVIREIGHIRYVGDVGLLFQALAKAQAEFVEMERDAQVAFDKRMFNYATLAEVLASVRPALNKHGLALLQPFDGDRVTTILAFGGARLEVDAPLPSWKDVQALGSALTYLKRYQLKSMLGVNDGEDDDGNESAGSGKQPEPRTRAQPPQGKVAPKAEPGGLLPETRARIVDLAKAAGFQRADLESVIAAKSLGTTLDALTELNGAKLVVELERLRAQ